MRLEKADLDELIRLTAKARETPAITFSVEPGLEVRDWASQAWDKVRDKWDELGRKYGFNPKEVRQIDPETGEVLFK